MQSSRDQFHGLTYNLSESVEWEPLCDANKLQQALDNLVSLDLPCVNFTEINSSSTGEMDNNENFHFKRIHLNEGKIMNIYDYGNFPNNNLF